MTTPAVHYGLLGRRASCGRRKVAQATVDPSKVTCLKCKGTLQFKTRWFAGA